MKHLITTELIRIAHRRMTHVVLAVSILLIAVSGVMTFRGSSDATADMGLAQQRAIDAEADCLASYADETYGNETYGMTDQEVAATCQMDPNWFVEDKAFRMRELLTADSWFDVTGVERIPEWAETRAGHLNRSEFTTMSGRTGSTPAWGFNGTLPQLGATLAVVGALMAASWIGADWRSGVMENHLIREPRRRRLLAAKLTAAAASSALYAAAISVILVGAMLPSAIWRGDFAGTGDGFWSDVALVIVRVAIAAALLAIGSGALVAVTRSSTAGIVAVLGVSLLGSIAAAAWHPLARFSLAANLEAWTDLGDVTVFREFAVPTGGTEGWDVVIHGWWGAGLLLIVGGAITAVAGASIFARRDVA